MFKEEINKFESLGSFLFDTIDNRKLIYSIFSDLPEVVRKDIPNGREMSSFICFESDNGLMYGKLLTVSWIKARNIFLLSSRKIYRRN